MRCCTNVHLRRDLWSDPLANRPPTARPDWARFRWAGRPSYRRHMPGRRQTIWSFGVCAGLCLRGVKSMTMRRAPRFVAPSHFGQALRVSHRVKKESGDVGVMEMAMKRAPLMLAAVVVTGLLMACGDTEVREIVVTATPDPSSKMESSAKVLTDTTATATTPSASTSVPTPKLTTQPTTSTPVPTPTPDAEHESQMERSRAAIKRYVEEEQDAATLTNVLITCAENAGIALTNRIKSGGRAEDQLSELILTGVLDNYDVLECTAAEIAKEVDDGR